ncbi:INO80 complex subunit B [Venturia canescens]|uniref:INO80 complex subunit B n=1 Tax=Venturia canescens TaxID=32260 RepID=UPI001C9CB273|nr:INO80 complex subunit B [Venturia canescens]
MGKTGETSTDEDTTEIGLEKSFVVCQKRRKKHKHKRHKRKKNCLEDGEGSTMVMARSHPDCEIKNRNSTTRARGKKLHRVNKGTIVTTVTATAPAPSIKLSSLSSFGGSEGTIANSSASSKITVKKKVPRSCRSKESATSSEEERWLDAIESGKLEEVDDELKKIKPKDPKLMTARQRAMFERKTDAEPNPGAEILVSLPSGYKEKIMTAEAIQKAALKSLKRKQLADEKREKDKKKTMERLLKKQESKASKLVSKGKACKRQVPFVTYHMTTEGSWISLPPGHEFPLSSSYELSIDKNSPTVTIQSKEKRCSVVGCSNPRRYCCSKTGLPLCSLECYRAHMTTIST